MNVSNSILFKEYARPVLQEQVSTPQWKFFLPESVVGFVESVMGVFSVPSGQQDSDE